MEQNYIQISQTNFTDHSRHLQCKKGDKEAGGKEKEKEKEKEEEKVPFTSKKAA